MTQPEGAFDTVRQIEIGRFTIRELACGIMMLENTDGEGVEIKPEMLTKLFVENFFCGEFLMTQPELNHYSHCECLGEDHMQQCVIKTQRSELVEIQKEIKKLKADKEEMRILIEKQSAIIDVSESIHQRSIKELDRLKAEKEVLESKPCPGCACYRIEMAALEQRLRDTSAIADSFKKDIEAYELLLSKSNSEKEWFRTLAVKYAMEDPHYKRTHSSRQAHRQERRKK